VACTSRWFLPGGFPQHRLEHLPETGRFGACSGAKRGFAFAAVEHLQACKRERFGTRLRQLSELRGYRPAFCQSERHRRDRLLKAFQVGVGGSRVDAAEDPACFLHTLPGLNLFGRLSEVVESDDTAGDQEIRQKPLRVWHSGRVSLPTIDRDNENAPVLSGVTVAVAAMRIGMHLQAMDLATQRTRLVFISDVALLQEIRYVVFDCV